MSRKKDLGRITQHEVLVVLLFILLILLLFFKSPKFIPGWAELEIFRGKTQYLLTNKLLTKCHDSGVGSATPSVLIVALAFLLPSKWNKNKPAPALLDWKTGVNDGKNKSQNESESEYYLLKSWKPSSLGSDFSPRRWLRSGGCHQEVWPLTVPGEPSGRAQGLN